MQQEIQYARDWLASGHAIVLVVVSKTWGSAPRPVGSLMIIHANGQFEGSVSGGCIEGTVILEAESLMGQTASKTLKFSIANKDAWQIGLACGGEIQIQLFPLGPQNAITFEQTLTAYEERRNGELVLNKSSDTAEFRANESKGPTRSPIFDDENSTILPITPKPALFIVGAVHIAQALIPMAQACDYTVTVIDPRGLFVKERHFSGAKLVQDWPDEFFKINSLDANTAVATLTHDPKIDDAALLEALKSDAFYIGSLGSKKTHAERIDRLKAKGFNEKQLARVHGPIGLNIGSRSAAEIAISILAQMIAVKRDANAI